jgi:Ca2+-binding RTX toxin-like protein
MSGGLDDDVLAGGPGADTISGGLGNDTIKSKDGHRDLVRCGVGRDVASVDKLDRVSGCERVIR